VAAGNDEPNVGTGTRTSVHTSSSQCPAARPACACGGENGKPPPGEPGGGTGSAVRPAGRSVGRCAISRRAPPLWSSFGTARRRGACPQPLGVEPYAGYTCPDRRRLSTFPVRGLCSARTPHLTSGRKRVLGQQDSVPLNPFMHMICHSVAIDQRSVPFGCALFTHLEVSRWHRAPRAERGQHRLENGQHTRHASGTNDETPQRLAFLPAIGIGDMASSGAFARFVASAGAAARVKGSHSMQLASRTLAIISGAAGLPQLRGHSRPLTRVP
jgi:hypothetical protein